MYINSASLPHEPILDLGELDEHTGYSIFSVADWFLNKVECDHKKLQKLCYYAQAWSLALRDYRFISGDFQAWVHGPVNCDLWTHCRGLGYEQVPVDYLKVYHVDFSEDDDAFLDRVLATYGKFSGYDLECLTHVEQPWINARGDLGSAERCQNVIKDSDMKEYYLSLLADG